jgi:hypothetical protein
LYTQSIKRAYIMKEQKIEMNLNEISVLRGILFEYYQTLRQDYLCEEERVAHESLERKLAIAETESIRS